MKGAEFHFNNILRTFQIYIKREMLLPMILVRNHIRDMLGGETDKITFGKESINLGLLAIRNSLCVQYIGSLGGC